MIGVALYQEAREILTESLAVFRDHGDTASEAEAVRLLGTVRDAVGRWTVRPGLDGPTP